MTRKPWVRHHPTAERIAAELRAHDALLGLRTRALLPDVVEKFGVAESTAKTAIARARRKA